MNNLFYEKGMERYFEIIIEAKGDSLLTIDAYREMLDLHEAIKNEVFINITGLVLPLEDRNLELPPI